MSELPNKTKDKCEKISQIDNIKKQTNIQPNKNTRKRKSSECTNQDFEPLAKYFAVQMSSKDKPITIEDIRSLLDKQTNDIDQKIQCYRKAVSEEVAALGDKLEKNIQSKVDEVNTRIDNIHVEVSTQMKSMKMTVNHCVEQLKTNEDDSIRIAKLNELKIIGITYSPDHDLQQLFTEIAKVIGFDLTSAVNIPQVTRAYHRNKITNEMSPSNIVIVKFIAKFIRDNFYSAYLQKIAQNQMLQSGQIGLAQGGRIIISESLTVHNTKIFIEANKLKRDGKLAQLYTQDGIVHIKATKTDKPTRIRSVRDLDEFMMHANISETEKAPTDSNTMEITTNETT